MSAALQMQDRPITLLICALGGEGGGVLTQWLVDTARLAGHRAQATSIPGVAQRTGSTTYYLEFDSIPSAQRTGPALVFNLSPVPGALDALVASELLEAARQAGNGMTSPERTLVLSSSARTLTTLERMAPGDGRLDDAGLRQLVATFSREHQVLDMAALARRHGTVVSAVMLGAIAGSGLLPFERRHYEEAVRGEGAGQAPLSAAAQASLQGFAAAFEEVAASRTRGDFVASLLAPERADAVAPTTAEAAGAAGTRLVAADSRFPEPLRPLLALGCERLLAYQGSRYARQYLDRVADVLAAEQAGGEESVTDHGGAIGLDSGTARSGAAGLTGRASEPQTAKPQDWPITRETARGLAVWMAFDDVIRVAELKSRSDRLARVRREARAGTQDVLKVFDHFKPGVPEFAALLPSGLARRLLAWDAKRQARGDKPWALPLKIGTHTVTGVLALRALALLKPLRPFGSRWAAEQALIDRWLQAVREGTQLHPTLGLELARCCRLVKGYGGTHERGRELLLHVLQHLGQPSTHHASAPEGARVLQAAQAVAATREAALADSSGKALTEALRRHGAPPQPLREQPIRWVRKPKAHGVGS
jgi:indolepyruvate ferredoxin oxidoreductase beta subunit